MYWKRFMPILTIMASLLVTGCSSTSEVTGNEMNKNRGITKEETITLKFASYTSPEHDISINAIIPFMEQVTERTNGRVQFAFFPNEHLEKAAKYVDITGSGAVDISFHTPAYTPIQMPISSELLGLPNMFENIVDSAVTMLEVSLEDPILDTDYLSNGIRPLIVVHGPGYDIFTVDKEVRVPDDVKGLKFRTPGGSIDAQLFSLEIVPVSISATDTYEAFNKGIVDGILYFPGLMGSFSWNEVVNYSTRGLNLGTNQSSISINEDVFQGLPKDIQDVLVEVGKEITKTYAENSVSNNEKVIDEWKNSGEVVFNELTEAEKEKWNIKLEEHKQNYLKMKDAKFVEAYEMFRVKLGEKNE